MFRMLQIPADFTGRGWKIVIDGQEVRAGMVELVSDRWGHLTYGLRPEGFDSWNFKMRTSAVTLPYAITPGTGKLLVGLLRENRANMGGEQLCVIGGFTDPDETVEQAQERERDEESGLSGKAFPLGGLMVTDRLFFNASEEGIGGNIAFAQKIAADSLVKTGEREWHLKQGDMSLSAFKKAQQLVFLEWVDAVLQTKDGIAIAALARLRAAFDRNEL